jgi:TonB family protein
VLTLAPAVRDKKFEPLSALRIFGFSLALFLHLLALIMLSLSDFNPVLILQTEQAPALALMSEQAVVPVIEKPKTIAADSLPKAALSLNKKSPEGAGAESNSLLNPEMKTSSPAMLDISDIKASDDTAATGAASVVVGDSQMPGASDRGNRGDGRGDSGQGSGASGIGGNWVENVTPIRTPETPYPLQSIRRNEQGLVMVLIKIDVNGFPSKAEIVQSSGSANLDQATIKQVMKKFRYKPAMRNGVAIESYAVLRHTFTLGGIYPNE